MATDKTKKTTNRELKRPTSLLSPVYLLCGSLFADKKTGANSYRNCAKIRPVKWILRVFAQIVSDSAILAIFLLHPVAGLPRMRVT
ncbi:hypothetical protein [Candidatus Pantoea soli]|uniref:hypothetical protein n=1 Tax=Candidatus Pantoea soli TaxID=3098669 RepID=UPI001C951301|nr:hypothetical protein [Pantoea soli]